MVHQRLPPPSPPASRRSPRGISCRCPRRPARSAAAGSKRFRGWRLINNARRINKCSAFALANRQIAKGIRNFQIASPNARVSIFAPARNETKFNTLSLSLSLSLSLCLFLYRETFRRCTILPLGSRIYLVYRQISGYYISESYLRSAAARGEKSTQIKT